MKLLVINLPDLNKSVCLAYDDNTTTTVDCYLLDVSKDVDLRTIPNAPDAHYKVDLTPLVLANVVVALTQMIQKANQG